MNSRLSHPFLLGKMNLREELRDFLSMLIVYCEQNDDTAGLAATKALGKYAEAPNRHQVRLRTK